MSRSAAAAWLTSTALWAPANALACAVCGGGDTSANQWAFQWTTAFLSLLPLLMIGGVALYVYRATRAAGAEVSGATYGG